MIRDAEIRRIAGATGVAPGIVELDYVLGWALRGIAGHESLADQLVFKGGTCLRKCYFPSYRFSQDLDFTVVQWRGWDQLEEAATQAFAEVAEASAIDFAAREQRLRIIDDEYGRESLRLTIYWQGPRAAAGSPPGLRLDITRHEVLAFDPVRRTLVHEFSDSEELGEVELSCYRLDEVMAEKVRAVLGQRIFAVSRDLYDIARLREHVNDRKVLEALPAKFDARELDVETTDLRRLTDRRDEFQADWERNLMGLLPAGAEQDFDDVWDGVVAYVVGMLDRLDSRR